MPRKSDFSPEVRERAVRLVTETRQSHDSEWSAITSVAEKIGCTPETLRKWTRQSQRDAGTRPGPTTEDKGRIKDLDNQRVYGAKKVWRQLRREDVRVARCTAFDGQNGPTRCCWRSGVPRKHCSRTRGSIRY